ncbi:hypothetical protein JCM11641_003224 [Rhodosporidiobolus odoratus]
MSLVMGAAFQRRQLGSIRLKVESSLPRGLAPPAALVNAAILAERGKEAVSQEEPNRFGNVAKFVVQGKGAIAALVARYADVHGETRATLNDTLLPTQLQIYNISLERPLTRGHEEGDLFTRIQSHVPERRTNSSAARIELHVTAGLVLMHTPHFLNASSWREVDSRGVAFANYRLTAIAHQDLSEPHGLVQLGSLNAHIVFYLSIYRWIDAQASGGPSPNSEETRIALFYLSLLVHTDLEWNARRSLELLLSKTEMCYLYESLPAQGTGEGDQALFCRRKWTWARSIADFLCTGQKADEIAVKQARWHLDQPVLRAGEHADRSVYDMKERYLVVLRTIKDFIQAPFSASQGTNPAVLAVSCNLEEEEQEE